MFKKITLFLFFLILPIFSYASLDQYGENKLSYASFEEWKEAGSPNVDPQEVAEQKRQQRIALENQEENEPILYRNDNHKFRIKFPVNWEEIPKNTIDEFKNLATKEGSKINVDYIAGFQLSNSEYFQYPYMLIQKINTEKIPSSQLESLWKSFYDEDFQEVTQDQLSNIKPELLNDNNTKITTPLIDKERNMIFLNIEMNVANIGKIKGLMVSCLGKDSIIQLLFYSTEEEYSDQLPIFNSIIDSFAYEDGFSYVPNSNTEEGSVFLSKDAIDEGLDGIVTGAFLALIVGISGFFSIKKSKNNRYCKNCGNKINKMATFCNKCGEKFNK